MNRPIIGITPIWDETKDSVWMLPGYLQCVEDAGAAPVILPLTASESVLQRTVDICDGILFTGGHDVNPAVYGMEKRNCCGEICDTRDKMETYILREAVLNQNKPALGICRGLQFINAMLGGTLYQDIPTEFSSVIGHSQSPPYDIPVHAVHIIPESPLGQLIGKERIEVNSCHHQGINRLADALEIMALSDDGLAEAVHMPSHKYLWAVQWHPECCPQNEVSKQIFAVFTDKSRR